MLRLHADQTRFDFDLCPTVAQYFPLIERSLGRIFLPVQAGLPYVIDDVIFLLCSQHRRLTRCFREFRGQASRLYTLWCVRTGPLPFDGSYFCRLMCIILVFRLFTLKISLSRCPLGTSSPPAGLP